MDVWAFWCMECDMFQEQGKGEALVLLMGWESEEVGLGSWSRSRSREG